MPAIPAAGRQVVEGTATRELHRLEVHLRGGSTDHDREVVGRARGGAERAYLLVEELDERLRVQDGLGLLVQEGLVRRAAALRDEQEAVLVAGGRVEIDLRRQVGPGVHLLEEVDRRHLRVAQVRLGVGLVDSARDRLLVVARSPDALALLADRDGGSGILARGEDHPGGDARVAQHVECDEAIVGRRLGIVQDPAQLAEVPRPEEVAHVAHRFGSEPRQGRRIDQEDRLAAEGVGRDPITLDAAVGRPVLAVGEHLLELEVRHACSCAWVVGFRSGSATVADPGATIPPSRGSRPQAGCGWPRTLPHTGGASGPLGSVD